MTDRLAEYRRKRDAARTPEPVPAQTAPAAADHQRFVIQQHHARSLHWDVRLERDGVLVSFAVPRGLPRDQGRNNLAKHTEDHPLEYLEFSGEIPAGEYGGGRMTIFDRGTYEAGKWRDDEIGVTFHGERTNGRYVFFQTGGNDWMVRRMDPPEPGWEPMPDAVPPMLAAEAAGLPSDDGNWAYEMGWGGRRVEAYVGLDSFKHLARERALMAGLAVTPFALGSAGAAAVGGGPPGLDTYLTGSSMLPRPVTPTAVALR